MQAAIFLLQFFLTYLLPNLLVAALLLATCLQSICFNHNFVIPIYHTAYIYLLIFVVIFLVTQSQLLRFIAFVVFFVFFVIVIEFYFVFIITISVFFFFEYKSWVSQCDQQCCRHRNKMLRIRHAAPKALH